MQDEQEMLDEYYDEFFPYPTASSTADYADYRNDTFSIHAVAGTWDAVRRALQWYLKSADGIMLEKNRRGVQEVLDEIIMRQD